MVRVRDAHFFRKVPKDVTEATKLGGILSVIAVLTIGWLVREEYALFRKVKLTTELHLDQSSMPVPLGPEHAGDIRINFNLTMHRLPCLYAHMQVADHVGSHKMGGTRNVHKVRIDRNGNSLGIFHPHRYQDKAEGDSMAEHVFPWHKQMHTQGDAEHRDAAKAKHLSRDQAKVLKAVEKDMKHSTGGTAQHKAATTGRRLLSVEEPPAATAVAPAAAIPAANAAAPAADTSESCGSWAEKGECENNAKYMLAACATSCSKRLGAGAPAAVPAATATAAATPQPAAAAAAAAATPATPAAAVETPPSDDGAVYVPGAFNAEPLDLTEAEFEDMVHKNPLVFINYYAPWCYWSNKLAPDWMAVMKRLHQRAYSQSVVFARIDCTTEKGRALCQKQAVHAFPSVRIYRGSIHAYEPYEFGREENLLWLHLVKLAAEVVISTLKELPNDDRRPFQEQVSHISQDLKLVMERREQGLDEDWSEDALSAEEEVEEDSGLLKSIDEAVRAITNSKGVRPGELHALGGGDETERTLLEERSSSLVLGLITNERQGVGGGDEPEMLEAMPGANAHEGCVLFGYVDVSRAPGTLHVAPHSARHSFDFSKVNVSHHIDHLSFGLELPAKARARLPAEVQTKLLGLDGREFAALTNHQTLEHHVNIMPTSFRAGSSFSSPIETYQFTSTSHSRTKDALPSLIVSYEVSPIQVRITATHQPLSEFLINLCAIVGGAFAIFGILDAVVFEGGNIVKKKMGIGKQF